MNIHELILSNDCNQLRTYLENTNSSDIERLDSTRTKTPLMTAAAEGNVEMVRLLIEYGANPRARIGYNTALIYAAFFDSSECVEELLKYEPDRTTVWWSSIDAAHCQAPSGSDSYLILDKYLDEHPTKCDRLVTYLFCPRRKQNENNEDLQSIRSRQHLKPE